MSTARAYLPMLLDSTGPSLRPLSVPCIRTRLAIALIYQQCHKLRVVNSQTEPQTSCPVNGRERDGPVTVRCTASTVAGTAAARPGLARPGQAYAALRSPATTTTPADTGKSSFYIHLYLCSRACNQRPTTLRCLGWPCSPKVERCHPAICSPYGYCAVSIVLIKEPRGAYIIMYAKTSATVDFIAQLAPGLYSAEAIQLFVRSIAQLVQTWNLQ